MAGNCEHVFKNQTVVGFTRVPSKASRNPTSLAHYLLFPLKIRFFQQAIHMLDYAPDLIADALGSQCDGTAILVYANCIDQRCLGNYDLLIPLPLV